MLFVVLSLISCASYASVTYTYTGNPYDHFSPGSVYSPGERIYGSVTFASQPNDTSSTSMLSEALSFSFSDSLNANPITNNTILSPDFFCGAAFCTYPLRNMINYMHFDFDAQGNVSTWDIELYPDIGLYVQQNQNSAYPFELLSTNLVSRMCGSYPGTNCDYVQTGNDDYDESAWTTDSGTWTTTINAAVPEPDSYAMLLAGLGLLGWFGHRRRNEAA